MNYNRHGFSLVEIVVVLVLVILLLLISLGGDIPLSMIEKAREVSSVSKGLSVFVACIDYDQDHGVYPSGDSSTEAFQKLFPTYLRETDLHSPNSVLISNARGHIPFDGSSFKELKHENLCWTFVMNHGAGLMSKDPSTLPLLLSDVVENYPTFPSGGTTWIPTEKNIWLKDGVTLVRLDESSEFLRPKGNASIALTPPDFKAPPGADYADVAP